MIILALTVAPWVSFVRLLTGGADLLCYAVLPISSPQQLNGETMPATSMIRSWIKTQASMPRKASFQTACMHCLTYSSRDTLWWVLLSAHPRPQSRRLRHRAMRWLAQHCFRLILAGLGPCNLDLVWDACMPKVSLSMPCLLFCDHSTWLEHLKEERFISVPGFRRFSHHGKEDVTESNSSYPVAQDQREGNTRTQVASFDLPGPQPMGLLCPLQLILPGKYPQRHTQRSPQPPRSSWQRLTFTLRYGPSPITKPLSWTGQPLEPWVE